MKKPNPGLLFAVAGVAFLLVMGFAAPEPTTLLLTAIIINIVFAVSFNLLFGYAGMISLGQSIFFGMGGYFLLIFMTKAGISLLPSILLSIVCSMLLAAGLGFVALRNGMASFAFLMMAMSVGISTLFKKWAWVGNDIGLQMNFLPEFLKNFRVLYLFLVVMSVLLCVVMYLLTKSPFISICKGVRENEERLAFLGINTSHLRLTIFVVSSFFSSVAGILQAFRDSGAFASSLENTLSFKAIIMCMIGGTTYFAGPIIGAIIVTLFYNYLSTINIYYQGIFGFVAILMVYFARDGILDGSKKLLLLVKKKIGKGQGSPAENKSTAEREGG